MGTFIHVHVQVEIELQDNQQEEEENMSQQDIIGIANDRARNIKNHAIFDPNSMKIGIIRPIVTMVQF